MPPVIVFGPTGQIGSVVARTAAKQGANVWLAMRDTSKMVPGLNATLDQVRADLSQPDTVEAAVKASGAKRAFVYLAWGSADHMKATFEALKAGGIEFVVFLSSFTIYTDRALCDIPASEAIPYIHAQAEANLDDVFEAENYVVLRPGAFSSNLLQHLNGIAAGHVDLYGGDFLQDNITPEDIGRVGGNILVSGARNGQQKVYLYGPEISSNYDGVLTLANALGREVKITRQGRKEAYDNLVKASLPDSMATYFCDVQSDEGRIKTASGERFPSYDAGVNNMKLYTGKPPTTLADWAKENAAKWQGQ